jgi:predicted permease
MATALYARALRTLPADLWQCYGVEMVADFQRVLRGSAISGGAPAIAATLIRGLADVVYRLPGERLERRRAKRRAAAAGGVAGGPKRGSPVQDLLSELRVAARSLARRPTFSVAAILTLALGLGATLAIYTIIQSVLLRPLPYPDSDRIVTVVHRAPGLDLPELENSVGTLRVYTERSRTLINIAGTDREERNLSGGDQPARVGMLRVSPGFFDVVRVEPAIGRRFRDEDAQPGPIRVAILMHGAWQDRFGGERDILGRVIQVDGVPVEVVGVMPRDFVTPEVRPVEFLVPFYLDPSLGFGTFGIEGFMRLAPGVDLAQAQNEMTALQSAFAEPEQDALTAEMMESSGWSAEVIPLRSRIVRKVERTLWVLLGTVSLVLLIACANVANLLLVRGEGRHREVTIRAALGAGRRRIAATFLAESLLLALLGGVIGSALAWAGVRVLVAYGPEMLPRLGEVRVDLFVLAVALGLTVLTGLVLSLAPIVRGLRSISPAALRDGGVRTTAGRERHRARSALIAVQVALALVLLVGSGLMLRSFWKLRSVDPGVQTENVVAIGVSRGSGGERQQEAAFYQQVLDEVSALPGVEVAGASNALPLIPEGLNGSSIEIRSKPREETELPPVVMYTTVLPGYFEANRIRVLEGRAPERADHEARRNVVWVSDMFARRYLDGRALGEVIRIGNDSTWLEIAGVVSDVRIFGLDEEIRPHAYLPPTTTVPSISNELMHIVVKHSGDAAAVGAAVRGVVTRIDPTVPIANVRTMEAVLAHSLARMSFTLVLLVIAAGVALVLGLVGLYGAISYVVAQRTREIGVRIALGADGRRVQGMVLRQGLAIVIVGVIAGLITAAATTRVLDALLFEVASTDPVTFIATPVLLLAVGALAAWLPARRAAKLSPLVALRAE